jgi:general secretion pathway protein G
MKKAFTMIELVFVIVILGILASVAIPRLSATRDDAEVVTGLQRANHLITGLTAYYTAHGAFESNLSKMTNEPLMDSSKHPFSGNFKTAPAYFGNTVMTKSCIKVVADDTNGTLTLTASSDGSSYCRALISEAVGLLKTHKFGGSMIYN